MLKYAVFWFVFRVLGRLPLWALYNIAALVGDGSFLAAGKARANVIANLRHVQPGASRRKLRGLARRVFRNVAYYYADLAHLPHMDVQRFYRERLKLNGYEEHLLPAYREGKGVAMISAHYGNPEIVMQALIPLGIDIYALTEPVEPPRLSRLLDSVRSSKGLRFQPVDFAGVKRLVKTLRGGGVAALMGDRDIEGPRMLLPFFGQETLMPTGPIEVALRTGAAIVPSFCARRLGRKFEAFIHPPLQIERTDDFQADVRTAALAWIACFEEHVRREPGQWAVLECIWEEREHESMRT